MGELLKKEKEELLQAISGGLAGTVVTGPPLTAAGNADGQIPQSSFVQLQKVIFDDKFPARQAMENVLATFTDPHFNLVYLLMCKDNRIKLLLGVIQNTRKNRQCAHPMPAGEKARMLSNAFQGNYHGSKIEHLNKSDMKTLFSNLQQLQKCSIITGMPCLSEEKLMDGTDFQGIDRLINACIKREWALMVICEPVPRETVRTVRSKLCDIYDFLAETSKTSIQQSQNESTSETRGRSETDDDNVNRQKQDTTSKGHGNTVSYEKIQRQMQDYMRYIEDTLLRQLDEGMGKGMFQTTVYAMAKDDVSLSQVQSLFCATFQGRANPVNPLVPCEISGHVHKILRMQSDTLTFAGSGASNLLLSHQGSGPASAGTLLDARTLSMIAAVPQVEVPGLTVQEGVGFGLNMPEVRDGIELGCLLDRGRRLHKVSLPKEALCKHIFIGGVTGSGKTTTCQTLLGKAGLPFIVIEPAKTEYRAMRRLFGMKELHLFTFGDETRLPFRLNPFELFPGENLSAHVDMLKACFVNAMPMEAALPMVFEEALYRCYQFYGWNTEEGINRFTDDPFTEDGMYFPILQDMIPAIEEVAAEKHFSATMQGDYIGSLAGRISNLLVGAKGRMLNCRRSFDILELLDGKAVFELEELKAPQDKAFVMGLLLSRISEGLKRKHAANPDYRHITLVEEAHRLLSRPDPGETGARKNSVEIFTDLLAETRKYGESLVVVDQIPNKLAPDVLKNTNTKIIHRIFAKDDKDAIGDAILLDQKQREYLSSLAVGEVVLFSEDFEKPVDVKIKGLTNTAHPEDPREMDAFFERQRDRYAHYLVHCAPHLRLTPDAAARITQCGEDFALWRKTLYTVLPPGKDKQDEGILEKINEAGQTLDAVIQKTAGAAMCRESDVWDELVWRFMLRRGIVARTPGGRKWRELYQTWCGWYEVQKLKFQLSDLEMLRKLRSQQILGIKGEELPLIQ